MISGMDEMVDERLERLAAVEGLIADLQVRFAYVEGEVVHIRGVTKAIRDRLTAIEVLRAGSEEGSFAWALVMLRHGSAMRRRAWGDAGRVEQFDWHRYLDGCPDEDLLASDWQRAF